MKTESLSPAKYQEALTHATRGANRAAIKTFDYRGLHVKSKHYYLETFVTSIHLRNRIHQALFHILQDRTLCVAVFIKLNDQLVAMTRSDGPVDVSRELAKLKHEKKNHDMRSLPPDVKIQRRPLNHAPVASPFAGSNIPKVIYVSRRTPVMSAVKRVKKFLRHIENRAHQGFNMLGKNDRDALNELAEVSEKLKKSSEAVIVKASGRAMEQALRVGEWFRTREDEVLCRVEIRTSSVAAIDDIVTDDDCYSSQANADSNVIQQSDTTLEGGDTNMDTLGNTTTDVDKKSTSEQLPDAAEQQEDLTVANTSSKRRRRKRKRETYDKDDLPEARLRWVKTVEVAISLRG